MEIKHYYIKKEKNELAKAENIVKWYKIKKYKLIHEEEKNNNIIYSYVSNPYDGSGYVYELVEDKTNKNKIEIIQYDNIYEYKSSIITAKELFEKLGFELVEYERENVLVGDSILIHYKRPPQKNRYRQTNIIFQGTTNSTHPDQQDIIIYSYFINGEEGIDEDKKENTRTELTLNEIKAINKQCKELGWRFII